MNAEARIYLDHNATSPLRPEARRAVDAVHDGPAANPSSAHREGREARATLERARAQVAGLLACAPHEIVFTSGGSEAIAAAMRGVLERAPAARRRVIVPTVEHSAVIDTARQAARSGFVIVEIACDAEGRVDLERYRTQLSGDDVALACLQWANPETGVLQPIGDVGRMCRLAGVPFLVDAVQAAGKTDVDPREAFADLLAISGHKFGGPQGTGALYVRRGIELSSMIGGVQETRRRGGTPGVAAIAGFGAAAEEAASALETESPRWLRLRSRLETQLRERFPDVRFHGQTASRLPNTVNFSVPGVPGETLAIACDLAGFAVSTGSACASGAVEPSHVLRAMGYDDAEARGAVRVSVGWSTRMQDVDRFLEAIPGIVARVREGLEAPVEGV